MTARLAAIVGIPAFFAIVVSLFQPASPSRADGAGRSSKKSLPTSQAGKVSRMIMPDLPFLSSSQPAVSAQLARIMHVISHFFVVLYEVSTSGRALASPAAAAGLDDFGGLRLTT